MPLDAPTPERADLLLHWTEERARAAELLQRLGLADCELAAQRTREWITAVLRPDCPIAP